MGIRTSSNGATNSTSGGITTTSGIRVAPCYWTMDAMFSYKFTEKFSMRLNIYNLANERYIGSVGGGQFVPGPGRSAALTATYKF
jgi:catecholate siderophore receptor